MRRGITILRDPDGEGEGGHNSRMGSEGVDAGFSKKIARGKTLLLLLRDGVHKVYMDVILFHQLVSISHIFLQPPPMMAHQFLFSTVVLTFTYVQT